MIWVGLLLVGFAIADLGHSLRPVRWWPEAIAATSTLLLGLAAGVSGAGLVLLIALAAVVFGWGIVVRVGFAARQAWLPLSYAGIALVTTVFVAGVSEVADGGPLARYLALINDGLLAGTTTDRAVLVAGILLAQLSTGNVVMRLILVATNTLDPRADRDVSRTLKGGRLLGPMERLTIVGLGLAGQITAASIVIAAKGLLRFPELQSHRDSEGEASIDDVTEYFLVGSFLSWGFSLLSLALIAVLAG